jgi:hypothetical protein
MYDIGLPSGRTLFRLQVGPGTRCSPRHGIPFNSRTEGSKQVWMTGRATRARLYVQAERLLKLGRLAQEAQGAMAAGAAGSQGDKGGGGGAPPGGSRVPWYVMTSPFTHDATVAYFAQHAHFGLDPADVTFFQQGWLPCFDDHRKILMASRSAVATAPDGNGGLYAALHAAGCLDDMVGCGWAAAAHAAYHTTDTAFLPSLHALCHARSSRNPPQYK